MWEIIEEAFIDSVKLIPFLFLTYLAMEFLEHKTSAKTKQIVKNSGKAGPFFGALLGAFPQCGFSAAASNLYAGRVITLGTLIAIYLSTSDEMLPVLISEKISPVTIFALVGCKVIIGMAAGFAIDFLMRKNREREDISNKIGHMCEHDHCNCEKSIFLSALKHTAVIYVYILLITLALNVVIYYIGEDTIGNVILNRPVIGPLIATLVGLIPNCAASVALTQLYVSGVMSIGSTMAGLLAGSGVGIIVLFKENSNRKENIKIVGLLYLIGASAGIIIDLVMMVV